MNYVPKMNRRSFLAGTAAAGGGLALGIELPFGPDSAAAQGSTPELGVWVVVKPDESVIVRVVRHEMGQGTVTGIAQLIAEELEADWSKVSIEHPTPGESVKRKRAWGAFSTGGSRGIGKAVARELAREGASVALVARDPAALEAVLSGLARKLELAQPAERKRVCVGRADRPC